MTTRLFLSLAFGAAVLAASPALAHHSAAMFDRESEVRIMGVIKELQWTNPHAWIELEVPNAGKTVQWSVELDSPNILARYGWTSSTLKPGDRVTITCHPLKDGRPGGSYVSIYLPDGKILGRMKSPT
jgi:hypothetical protein